MNLHQHSCSHTLRRVGGKFTFLLLVFSILFVGISATAQDPTDISALQAAVLIEKTMVEAISNAEKSVVAIARVSKTERPVFADGNVIGPNEYGTGVVIDARGLILTNLHVIGDPEKNDYYVWTGRKPYKVVAAKGGDAWTDLAVLKIDAENLQPIKFGDATKLKKGNIVFALGNPYAIARDGEASASWGIISNLTRKATKNPTSTDPSRGGETLHHYGTLIQTDARLNLGTSGGALINLDGEMVGLTTSMAAMDKYEKSAGFAIPVDEVFKRVVKDLKQGKRAEFGFLGVGPMDLGPADRREGKLGVRISHVVHGTPAANARLRIGDVVTHVNGSPIYDNSVLMRELGKHPVHATVRLTIHRERLAPFVVPVELSKKYVDSSGLSFSEEPEQIWRGMKVDYATAIPYFVQKSANIDSDGCVAIVDVARDSPAWKAGLRPWTFINFVGRSRTKTPDDFYKAVTKQNGRVRINLTAVEGAASTIRVVSP